MPPKEDPTKNRTGGGKNNGNGQEPTDESGRSTRSPVKAAEAQRTALTTSDGGQVQPAAVEFGTKTLAEDVGKTSHGAPPANEARARSSTEGSQDAEMEDATVKDKVSASAKELDKLFYEYGELLIKSTQEVLQQAKGVDAQSAQAMSSSWSKAKKQFQPKLNACLNRLEDTIPNDPEDSGEEDTVHPRIKTKDFRDLVENAREDITDSLEDVIKWFVANVGDPTAIRETAAQKQAAYTQAYATILSKMSRDILERVSSSESVEVDFGRDSDYDQAMRSQHALASERDDLQLQLEGYRQQVEDLKASEADLYNQCSELQDKFSKAQEDLTANQHKDDSDRIADLESQLHCAKGANAKLQRTIANYEQQLTSGSGGAAKSLVERAREIGFVQDVSGKLVLGPPPSQGFDFSKPYAYGNRCG